MHSNVSQNILLYTISALQTPSGRVLPTDKMHRTDHKIERILLDQRLYLVPDAFEVLIQFDTHLNPFFILFFFLKETESSFPYPAEYFLSQLNHRRVIRIHMICDANRIEPLSIPGSTYFQPLPVVEVRYAYENQIVSFL